MAFKEGKIKQLEKFLNTHVTISLSCPVLRVEFAKGAALGESHFREGKRVGEGRGTIYPNTVKMRFMLDSKIPLTNQVICHHRSLPK